MNPSGATWLLSNVNEPLLGGAMIYSAIHDAAGLTVPRHSMISTGTIPVEQKSVHWLSMGAAGRKGLWRAAFCEQPVTKEPRLCE